MKRKGKYSWIIYERNVYNYNFFLNKKILNLMLSWTLLKLIPPYLSHCTSLEGIHLIALSFMLLLGFLIPSSIFTCFISIFFKYNLNNRTNIKIYDSLEMNVSQSLSDAIAITMLVHLKGSKMNTQFEILKFTKNVIFCYV